MARDLSIYLNATAPNTDGDLDASDDRLLAVIDLFERRKLSLAADKAQELAEAGVLDIRPLSYVLFVTFNEDGIGALATIFDVVLAIFGPQRTIIGPQRNQPAFFAKRLSWLWATMNDYMAYYRKENGADWKRMREGLTPESLAMILERGKNVAAVLSDASQERNATTLASFMGELRTLAAELDAAARASAKNAAEEKSAHGEDAEGNDVDEENAEHAAPEDGEASSDVDESSNAPILVSKTPARSGKRRVTLEVSPTFLELLDKLKAFETLVEQRHLSKAAIVADDLQNIIETFDPRAHFPGLFSRFSELLSTHSDELGELIEQRDSFSWKTMVQFYRVDLAKFVDGEGNDRGNKR